jgi:hypothetical protein
MRSPCTTSGRTANFEYYLWFPDSSSISIAHHLSIDMYGGYVCLKKVLLEIDFFISIKM